MISDLDEKTAREIFLITNYHREFLVPFEAGAVKIGIIIFLTSFTGNQTSIPFESSLDEEFNYIIGL